MVGYSEQGGSLVNRAILVDQKVRTMRALIAIAIESALRSRGVCLVDDNAIHLGHQPPFDTWKSLDLDAFRIDDSILVYKQHRKSPG